MVPELLSLKAGQMSRSLPSDVLHDILPAVYREATLHLICPQGPQLFCKLLTLGLTVPEAETMAESALECQSLG